MAISIITDSTADIPKELLNKYKIIEMPLTVHFGEEEFKDRIDITEEQFYEKLVSSKELPSTSQVNPVAFEEVYKQELQKGNDIISIHISSELSGTYQSAVIARDSIGSEKISLVDSRSATLALGMVVLKAAELAEKGLTREKTVEQVEEYKNSVKILIMVDTLEYLKKGGRLSGTQAMIGGILNIKPILTIDNGKVVVVEKGRGVKKASKRIVEIMKEKGNNIADQTIGIVNAKSSEIVGDLKELIKTELGTEKYIEASVGSVIATHVGPGAFGVVFV